MKKARYPEPLLLLLVGDVQVPDGWPAGGLAARLTPGQQLGKWSIFKYFFCPQELFKRAPFLRSRNYIAVFRILIRMDPIFFADPDPDFKNPDPDTSVYCFNTVKARNSGHYP